MLYMRFLRVGLDEVNTLLDVLLQVNQAGVKELLLVLVDRANLVDFLDTVGAELDTGGEEINTLVLEQRGVDEGGLDDALLALSGTEEGLGEAGTSHGHGESGRASTVLGLDDLVTTELDAVDQGVAGLTGDGGVAGLGQQGNDGDTGVTTDDGDLLGRGVCVLDLRDEARGTDDVKGGDTEQALGVVDTAGLVDLGDDGDGRVDLQILLEQTLHKFVYLHWQTYRVGDDQDVGLGGSLGSGLGEVADDGGVGVEQVVTGHTGLAGDTGGDEDDLRALEGITKTLGGGVVAVDSAVGVDVAQISSDT